MNKKILTDNMINQIFEQSGIIAYVDEAGRYMYVNSIWEKETGISRKHAVGKSAEELIIGSAAMLALRTGRTISGEMFMQSVAGKEISSIMRYRPIMDENGIVTGCFISSLFNNIDEAQIFGERLEHILEEFSYLKSMEIEGGSAKYSTRDIIGSGPQIERLKEQIYIAGSSNSACLIEGETGTGKELVAHAIHSCSRRSLFPFVRVNCSAIPENLMESEFFGYEEGSFTGSVKGGRAGKFEKAHLGSMFLDEINAMDLSMQPKLLRALQEKEIERIGGAESIPVDVRVIAASNMPLEYLVDRGNFRRDLFYRLNIITIRIPPLRHRKEDIYPLVKLFISRYHDAELGNATDISDDAVNYLCEHDWPGNVRELQNSVERAMAASHGSVLNISDFAKFDSEKDVFSEKYVMNTFKYFGDNDVERGKDEQEFETMNSGDKNLSSNSLSEEKSKSEKAAIIKALKHCGGNKSKAARMLKISRTLLYKKLEKYNIS
ncbi:MAG: sigma-54 interaction domain-containing protein [Anaerovoracaceae bacterium]